MAVSRSARFEGLSIETYRSIKRPLGWTRRVNAAMMRVGRGFLGREGLESRRRTADRNHEDERHLLRWRRTRGNGQGPRAPGRPRPDHPRPDLPRRAQALLLRLHGGRLG